MPDDLPFDPSQIISDDPNVRPETNVQDIIDAGGGPQGSEVAGTAQLGRDEIQDTGDPLVDTPNPANLQVDQGATHTGNTDWGFWSQNQVNYGNQYGSVADGVITALKAGHSWDEIQDYVNAAQPNPGGGDQLISRFKRPDLSRLMDPMPITAEELGVGF